VVFLHPKGVFLRLYVGGKFKNRKRAFPFLLLFTQEREKKNNPILFKSSPPQQKFKKKPFLLKKPQKDSEHSGTQNNSEPTGNICLVLVQSFSAGQLQRNIPQAFGPIVCSSRKAETYNPSYVSTKPSIQTSQNLRSPTQQTGLVPFFILSPHPLRKREGTKEFAFAVW